MAALQVTCIHLRQGSGGQVGTPTAVALHEQITHLGGDDWAMTRASVIASIEELTHTFYLVNGDGRRSVIGIVTRGGGRLKYLRGYGEGGWNDDLLALPRRDLPGSTPHR
jgi:hypothetical protein